MLVDGWAGYVIKIVVLSEAKDLYLNNRKKPDYGET